MWFTLASLSYVCLICFFFISSFNYLFFNFTPQATFLEMGHKSSLTKKFSVVLQLALLRNASGPHFRCVLTTPTWLCPGGGRGVSALRGRMEVSLSVLLDSNHNKDRSIVVPGLTPVPYSPPHQSLQIVISPGSMSTDRGATSSSSSDQGPWFADRLKKASSYSWRKRMRFKDSNNNLLYTQIYTYSIYNSILLNFYSTIHNNSLSLGASEK